MLAVTENLRTRQRAQTRQEILDAAQRVFETQGFAAGRTQDVAEEAGVSHGSVFAHFGSRDALIAEVVDAAILDAVEITRGRVKSANKVEDVLKGHLEGLVAHERIYARIIAERPFLPKHVQARVTEINSAIATHILAALTKSGFAAGLKVERGFAFNTWLALIHHYLMNRDLFAPSKSVLTAKGGELVRNYLAMVRRET
jgi:AcrR family transcriptional regulator